MKGIHRIWERLAGHKYYANIINMRGTLTAELSCHIFATKGEADEHRRRLWGNSSYQWIETVTFRSRTRY